MLPTRVRDEIAFFFVKTMDEVIEHALLPARIEELPVDADQLVSTRPA